MTVVDAAYFGREQTLVKHSVLKPYLTALALIVGRSFARDIPFVDCCSGPWKTVTDDLSDSSIGIAIQQLRIARDALAAEGRTVSFRCLFVEKDPHAYGRLEQFCNTVNDIEVNPLPGDFIERIPDILRFVAQRSGAFPFFFIDPTSWLPLKIKPLTPLLQVTPGEVLINFMTSFIRRFLEAEGKDFGELLDQQALDDMRGLTGQDRDDAAAFAYANQIGRAGNFPYVCTTIVLNPQQNRTHFHLIYATRHPKGVQVFKDAERSASAVMAFARADAQERHRINVSHQSELFTVEQHGAGEDQYLRSLRDRYRQRAHQLVEQQLILNRRRPIPYDEAWKIACRFPLVWETDLRQWIRAWRGKVDVRGMKPNQRVPKCQAGNTLVWTA
jgi:three-Cys-motif partner protein